MSLSPSLRNRLYGLAAFFWLVTLVVGYYVSHKPITPETALGLVLAGLRLGVGFGLIILAGGVGRVILHYWLREPVPDGLDWSAVALALGIGLLVLGVLLAGLIGAYRTWIGWLVFVVLFVLLRRPALAWLRQWKRLIELSRGGGRITSVLAGLSTVIVLIGLVVALAPPVKYDALVYHLALPRLYLLNGAFDYTPLLMYWGWPQTGEMIYTWAMELAGESTALVTGWAFGLVALAGLLEFSAVRLGKTAAWVSIAALLTGASLSSALAWGYVDWLVMLMSLAWLVLFAGWNGTPNRRLALAGLISGLAFGVKYTAGLLVLIGGIWLVCQSLYIIPRVKPGNNPIHGRRDLLRRIAIGELWFGLPAVAMSIPWLVKNWIATGNPVYPLLWPAGAMNLIRLEAYQSGPSFGGWQDVLFLPFRATWLGIEGGPGYSASIGPLLFGLALAGLVAWSGLVADERPTVRLALFTAGLGTAAWAIFGRFSSYLLQARIYYVIFPALAFLAAVGYRWLRRLVIGGVRLGRLTAVLILLALVLTTLELGVDTIRADSLGAAFGLVSTDEYLAKVWGWYSPAMQAVRDLPPDSRTLLLWESRWLYCLPGCEPDEIQDRWLRERYPSPGAPARPADEILTGWRDQGYTDLLVFLSGGEFIQQEGRLPYQPEDWQALETLLEELPVIRDFGQTYRLYRLTP